MRSAYRADQLIAAPYRNAADIAADSASIQRATLVQLGNGRLCTLILPFLRRFCRMATVTQEIASHEICANRILPCRPGRRYRPAGAAAVSRRVHVTPSAHR